MRRLELATALSIAIVTTGCARDLARASSGAIGCSPEEITIANISVGWSETSWAAACRGATFHCAGEHSPACAPSLLVSSPREEPPTQSPPTRTYERPPVLAEEPPADEAGATASP